MGLQYCIKAELNQKIDRKMLLFFFSNIYSSHFEQVYLWDKNVRERISLPDGFGEALIAFRHGYDESYFSVDYVGKIGTNSGMLVDFSVIESDDGLALCGVDLGSHYYPYDTGELFKEYDFRWHLEKLLEITSPYPIRRIWIEDDTYGFRGEHSTSFVVEGEVLCSWSHREDKVETRDAHYKGTTLLILEKIAANALAYGAELDNFYFEELVNKPFPQEFTINTRHGSFIVNLGLGFFMSIKPANPEQSVSDIRPYVEILTCLTRGLGLENFRLYAGPQKAIAL